MIEVKVARKRQEAVDIFSYDLVRSDGEALPSFKAGAHIDVHLPGGLIRQYSLCNAPGETHRYQIGVLREPVSRGGSVALHDQVQEGDTLTISEPRNNFELVADAKKFLLLAGGIGVTPLLSMAEQLSEHGMEFSFHYCGRSPDRMAFRDRIVDSAFAERSEIHVDDGLPEQRLNLAEVLAGPKTGVHLYVCGPPGFIDHVLSGAKSQGWSEEQLHREYFTADPAVTEEGDTFEVKIASTGQTFTIPEDRSVVSVLAEAGIEIQVSCEEGMCGSCVTSVIEVQGEIDHRDMFLSRKQHAEGKVFTPCCSRAKAGGVLVLDL